MQYEDYVALKKDVLVDPSPFRSAGGNVNTISQHVLLLWGPYPFPMSLSLYWVHIIIIIIINESDFLKLLSFFYPKNILP